jgi:hypothetical protein
MPFPNGTFLPAIRGLLGGAIAAVAEEFEQLYSLFFGYLSQEHNDDGTHGAITADSVTTDGLTVNGDVAVTGDVAVEGTVTWPTYGRFADGTVSAPSVGFSETAYNTGLWVDRVGPNDTLHMSVDGKASFFVNTNGTGLEPFGGVPNGPNGTGAAGGSGLYIGRNSSGNGAAGRLILIDRNGDAWAIWVDATGRLRINANSGPTENNTTVADTAGTLVSGGVWTPVAFNAANFTGNGAMTWTVASGDQVTLASMVDGDSVTVAFVLATTTVGGVVNTLLQIAIPGGYVAARDMWNGLGLVIDASVATTAGCGVAAGGTVIQIRRSDGANWTAGADTTYVYGQLTFEKQ